MLLQGRLFPVYGDMLALSATLLGAFILMSILTDKSTDDDDGPGGGMLTPVYNTTE